LGKSGGIRAILIFGDPRFHSCYTSILSPKKYIKNSYIAVIQIVFIFFD